ncbi:Protein of unknown function [Paenibacillus sp. yr247]|uniref:DUF3501 family protein n=1 Tax=Paenibacillus sp. yr247 TaxID=1761880 RepID=UPI0008819B38|nr:DUF3501 family protein [Paenibacillus sp. yr247]SDO12723.1 Protein of unknown function [Paenibacillus sp. yr247]
MTATITLQDIIPLEIYRQGRDESFNRMMAYKNDRRVRLAPHFSLLFENRRTVLFQIQELANSEDLTDPRELREYIDIYASMLPSGNELSATLFIELDNQQQLEELLRKVKGIERHLSLKLGNEKVQAIFEEEHTDRDFTTSVHYLKFSLNEAAKRYLINGSADSLDARLVLDHPHLASEIKLTKATIISLQNDF